MADIPLTTPPRAAGAATASAPGHWGRFVLQRLLGQGARSATWLAHDPRLESNVTLTLPVIGPDVDGAAITRWVQYGRRVSRLVHPRILPVIEADVREQLPYRVAGYTPGQTLAALLAEQGPLTAARAVALTIDMLDALTATHAAALLHRNLKPSNVLVDGLGRALLMDFGPPIHAEGAVVYTSPEGAQGHPANTAADIFAASLLLAEMLLGKPLQGVGDRDRSKYQLANTQLVLPADIGGQFNNELRGILNRALAYDPAKRYDTPKALRDVLVAWKPTPLPPRPEPRLDPEPVAEAAPAASTAAAAPTQPGASTHTDSPEATRNGTVALDALLARMRHKSDFPAMSDSVARIQGMANSENESVGSVTNEILKDVALTNKLLRLVNSAHFAARGGSINTVSRAVSLVGFNGIRNMALSLVLLEHMQDKSHANVLKDEFLRSLMAGSIATELCTVTRESEEAFIGAMFQNLGRMLTEFYFPTEARTVRGLMAATRNPLGESAASAKVLGVSFEALGLAVAQNWGLPEGIQHCMRKPRDEPPITPPVVANERVRWIAMAANEIADILLRAEPKDAPVRLALVARHYARTLGMSVEDVQKATVSARKKLIEMAAAMELKVVAGSGAAQLLQAPDEHSLGYEPPATDPLAPLALQATPAVESGFADLNAPLRRVSDILTEGIQDITHAMVDDFKLGDVLRMILETMFRAMQFQHIIFCMRDPKLEALTGRFGLGEGVEGVVKSFVVPLKGSSHDLFTAVCLKGADTMINDTAEARVAARLPQWYRNQIHAPSFLLLPLVIRDKPVGLIYADTLEKGHLVLDEKELALLRTLRNQAVMAFKQAT